MRILALADQPDPLLWERLDKRLLEGVDLIIACGDLPAAYLSFLTCFTHAPILYVHGNHDTRYSANPPEGCTCIEDMIYVYKGVRILGLGGSYRYKPGPCMYTEREMHKRVSSLRMRWQLRRQKGFDILVTHAPPRGIGDEDGYAHRGFEEFLTLCEKYAPKYLIHGHIHAEYTHKFVREHTCGETKVINAYQKVFIDL